MSCNANAVADCSNFLAFAIFYTCDPLELSQVKRSVPGEPKASFSITKKKKSHTDNGHEINIQETSRCNVKQLALGNTLQKFTAENFDPKQSIKDKVTFQGLDALS